MTTTIPSHNLVIQQAGVAQEITHQTTAPKPSPEQAAALQQAGEVLKNSTVQEFEESEGLKLKKEKESLITKQRKEGHKKKKRQEDLEQDPDATGKLLDTII
jgi:1,6-anhydro-N-acetylmuramate kinase